MGPRPTSLTKQQAVQRGRQRRALRARQRAAAIPPGTSRPATASARTCRTPRPACVAGNGCYTMVDRGTFNKPVNDGVITHLKIVSDKNTRRRARRREPADQPVQRLHRQPGRDHHGPGAQRRRGARASSNFLVSPDFQAAVAGFPNAIDPAFRPDAFPAMTLDNPLPPTAAPGDDLTAQRRGVEPAARRSARSRTCPCSSSSRATAARPGTTSAARWRRTTTARSASTSRSGKAATSYRVTTPAHRPERGDAVQRVQPSDARPRRGQPADAGQPEPVAAAEAEARRTRPRRRPLTRLAPRLTASG